MVESNLAFLQNLGGPLRRYNGQRVTPQLVDGCSYRVDVSTGPGATMQLVVSSKKLRMPAHTRENTPVAQQKIKPCRDKTDSLDYKLYTRTPPLPSSKLSKRSEHAIYRPPSPRSKKRVRQLVNHPDFDGNSSALEFYKVGPILGQGAFGKVQLAWQRITGRAVAVKSYSIAMKSNPEMFSQIKSELKLMSRFNHPCVIRLLETISNQSQTHAVMEYVQGQSLKALVRRHRHARRHPHAEVGGLDETSCAYIFSQLTAGLAHVHARNVVHRDIKLDNGE